MPFRYEIMFLTLYKLFLNCYFTDCVLFVYFECCLYILNVLPFSLYVFVYDCVGKRQLYCQFAEIKLETLFFELRLLFQEVYTMQPCLRNTSSCPRNSKTNKLKTKIIWFGVSMSHLCKNVIHAKYNYILCKI